MFQQFTVSPDVIFKTKLGQWQAGIIHHKNATDEHSVIYNPKTQMSIMVNNKFIVPIKPSYEKKPLTALDSILWGWFSKYIRLKYSDSQGLVKCCTCDTVDHWKKMDAGHFVHRDRKSVKFSELNVHPQCSRCNTYLKGNEYIHGRYIDIKYGAGTADKLILEGKKIYKFSRIELANLIEYYKEKAKILAKEKGQKIN